MNNNQAEPLPSQTFTFPWGEISVCLLKSENGYCVVTKISPNEEERAAGGLERSLCIIPEDRSHPKAMQLYINMIDDVEEYIKPPTRIHCRSHASGSLRAMLTPMWGSYRRVIENA